MENKGQIDFAVLIFISTLGMLALVFFIILMVILYQKRMQANKILMATTEKDHQKKLLDTILQIAEKERQTIAINVHDEVGLALSLLKINFNKMGDHLPKNEETENILSTSHALIENSIYIIRGIYSNIRPKTLMTMGLIASLEDIGREINSLGHAEVVIICRQEIKIEDQNTELQLHRLIKEVLNNTLRHAKPSFIEINIEMIENKLRVVILHNGMGITTESILKLAENSKGLGLKSIFTRVELLQGNISFTIESTNTAKVTIDCKV